MSALLGARDVSATRLVNVMSDAGFSAVEVARVEDHLVGTARIQQRASFYG